MHLAKFQSNSFEGFNKTQLCKFSFSKGSFGDINGRFFPYLYKIGNVGNKGFCRENKINSTKKLPPVGIEPETSFDLL